jgi:hypothetical protein
MPKEGVAHHNLGTALLRHNIGTSNVLRHAGPPSRGETCNYRTDRPSGIVGPFTAPDERP